MSQDQDKAFIDAARQQLDDSVKELDPAIGARLDALRKQALQTQMHGADESLQDWVESVKLSLDESAALPAAVSSRLDGIRRQALARERRESSSWWQVLNDFLAARLALPAGMVATAFVMVTAVSLFYVNSRPASDLGLEQEIGEIVSADLELYENLDFYLWLADNGLPD